MGLATGYNTLYAFTKWNSETSKTRSETDSWNKGLEIISSVQKEETAYINLQTAKGTLRIFWDDNSQVELLKIVTDLQAQVAAGCHSHPEDDLRFWWR